jgi:hypothetical protein
LVHAAEEAAPPEYQAMIDRHEALEAADALDREEDGDDEENAEDTWTAVAASVKHPAPKPAAAAAAAAAGGGIAVLMYDTPVSDLTIHNCDGPRNLDNVLHGEGCEVQYKDGRLYKGAMVNGKMHGDGIIKYTDGSSYIGTFVGGLEHGHGKIKKDGLTIKKGKWVAGKCQS